MKKHLSDITTEMLVISGLLGLVLGLACLMGQC